MSITKQGYNHFDKRKTTKYITKTDLGLLIYIKIQSKVDWRTLLINFKDEPYVWRFYPTFKKKSRNHNV